MQIEIQIQKADEIAIHDPDAAARSLAELRIALLEKLHTEPQYIIPIIQIIERQSKYLLKLNEAQKTITIIHWLLKLLHHDESQKCLEFLKLARDPFSRVLLNLSQALREINDYDEMAKQLKTAVDLSLHTEMAILHSILILKPLIRNTNNNPSIQWLSDRHAEFLAQLDFKGKNNTSFRKALDIYLNSFLPSSDKTQLQTQLQKLKNEQNIDEITQILIENIYLP